MSDEAPDGSSARGTSASGPGHDDQEVLTSLAGRIDPVHPIGPLALRARTRRPYVLAAVAVAALLGGAGAALVVTGSGKPVAAHNASAAGPASATPALPGAAGAGARPAAPGRAADPGVLHGQYVVRKPGGGYQIVDVQNGVITAVSSASVTLRSADGFSHSYAVTRSTAVAAGHGGITSIKVGDEASVLATVADGKAAATSITDLTALHHGSAL